MQIAFLRREVDRVERDRVEPRPGLQQRQLQQLAGQLRERTGELRAMLLPAASVRRRSAVPIAPTRASIRWLSAVEFLCRARRRARRARSTLNRSGSISASRASSRCGQPLERRAPLGQRLLEQLRDRSGPRRDALAIAAFSSAALADQRREVRRRRLPFPRRGGGSIGQRQRFAGPAFGSAALRPLAQHREHVGHADLHGGQVGIEQVEVVQHRIGDLDLAGRAASRAAA